MTRSFVAVYPSGEAIEHLDSFLDVRREAAPFRWALPDQWHLTLAFFADVPGTSLDELTDRLEATAGKRTSMPATFAGGGAFPHVAAAKVLWAGIELDDPSGLDRLAKACRAAGAVAGAPPSGGRFHPHLTLARLHPPVDATKWVHLLDSYRGPDWVINEIALVESHLGEGPRKRPRHEVVATFPFS